MDILLSTILGELATRSINFFISKISKQMPLDVEDRLRMVLLRAQVIVDEAMGQRITNHAMLVQLDLLRDAMHRGYYWLDKVRSQSHEEDTIHRAVRHSSPFSTVNCLKSWCLSSRNTQVGKQLHETLDCLSSMIVDLEELVIFLTSYPRLYCQPYSTHLQVSNCMFGRQMEAELLVNFLLHPQPKGVEELDVMPIVGPRQVGKSTLVAHVCRDERYVPRGSKIIVTSRFDNIIKFGTTQALTLKHLSPEAYWYFFKTLTFGSMDPEMHPRLTHIAMEIAKTQKSCLVAANMIARLLSYNFDVHFWCKVLAFIRVSRQKHVSRFGGHPMDHLDQNRPAHLGRMTAPSEDLVLYHEYQCSSGQEVPKIRIHDEYGSVKARGNFEVLAWRSTIPPYFSYVYTCEIQELKANALKNAALYN
ncbi:hypothetical protein U9M48_011470 [Paspalum notatum var. saurae]|uniref:Rx N-terminal domain-containing protein n=1 Tax=Paspalum notatum var. saurae TaxID=547442 RepID=A0AAQ3SX37_PASNO